MTELESALEDIARIRHQLAASSRFQGLAPGVVALTGGMALALAGWQAQRGASDLLAWILLAAVSAILIGTEAVIRARRLHRAMADRMLTTTLSRFLPAALAGAIAGVFVLIRAPGHAALLPGVWQLLMAVGILAVLPNLPRAMSLAAGFYFITAAASLALAEVPEVAQPWLMGLPFGLGQFLVAAILYHAARETAVGRA